MSESSELKCVWDGALPDYQKTEFCVGCQRQCSAPEVLRCQLRGMPKPEVKQSKVVTPQSKPVRKRTESGIGDCLKKYFDSIKAAQAEGCSCEDVRLQLNKRTSDQVEQELENWLDSIMANVKYLKGVKGTAIKMANYLLPKTMRNEVKSNLLRCMEESKAKLSQTAQDASKTDSDQKTTT